MALTFGAYAAPDWRRPLAVAAVVALTAVNLRGVQKTAVAHPGASSAFVLAVLAVVVVATLGGGSRSADNLGPCSPAGGAGCSRPPACCSSPSPATPASPPWARRCSDPARTIPRAIPIALGITLVVYATVAVSALLAAGPEALAASPAPLATAVRAGSFDGLAPLVRVGGAVAALGVLLSLIAGVSRTAFAMAADGNLPRWLDAVHPTRRVPHHAELAAGALVTVLVLVADLRGAIGFSSFTVLTYYAIANASAWTLPGRRRHRRAACRWAWPGASSSPAPCRRAAWWPAPPSWSPARPCGPSAGSLPAPTSRARTA